MRLPKSHLRRRWPARLGALLLAGTIGAAMAAGGGGRDGPEEDIMHAQPDYQAGIAAINDKRWADAATALARHVRQYARDADGHNWLAYAYRHAGRLDDAFRHYERALSIDPLHQGAHEYIGEAYLMAGKPQQAERHLQRLAALCGTQCEPYRDLKDAIDRYRNAKSSAAPANSAAPTQ